MRERDRDYEHGIVYLRGLLEQLLAAGRDQDLDQVLHLLDVSRAEAERLVSQLRNRVKVFRDYQQLGL